jgi:TonB family protein
MRIYIGLLAFVSLTMATYAASTKPISVDQARRQHLLIVFVRPEYPVEAKRHLWKGKGTFEVAFDYESGRVRGVHVVQSTGHQVLDASAVAALRQWRAKPESIHTLTFPITFTYTYPHR